MRNLIPSLAPRKTVNRQMWCHVSVIPELERRKQIDSCIFLPSQPSLFGKILVRDPVLKNKVDAVNEYT